MRILRQMRQLAAIAEAFVRQLLVNKTEVFSGIPPRFLHNFAASQLAKSVMKWLVDGAEIERIIFLDK